MQFRLFHFSILIEKRFIFSPSHTTAPSVWQIAAQLTFNARLFK